MRYSFHKDIPNKYRRAILDETLQKRVSKVSIGLCNEIIEEFILSEQENDTLKNYEIEYKKGNKHETLEVEGRKRTLVMLDRILEYGENKDPSVVIAVRQAGRLVSGYYNCNWMAPEPKDKLYVKNIAS